MLDSVVLFNTSYMDAAVDKLRGEGFDVCEADVERLSPFTCRRSAMPDSHSFSLPEMVGGPRPLREADDGAWAPGPVQRAWRPRA
ncbi:MULTISPECIES: transposase [Nocardiopsis]|uniref:transposase n=1 Tax=Nocardiopsis TaxID=2013 RepID=UPI000376DF39|nr:transposase [Nocardiopsis sp. CNS-639]